MKELLKLNRYFLKYKWTLIFGTGLLILANFFLIWIPVLIRETMDEIEQTAAAHDWSYESTWEVLLSGETGWFLALNTGYLILAALMYGFMLFATRQTLIVTSRKIEFDLRNDIYRHLQLLPQAFFDKTKLGDIYTRTTEDIVRVREYFGPAFMYTINTISRSGIIIVIMIMVHPVLTFWALLPLPLLSFMAYFVSKHINRRSNEIQQQYALLAGKVQEVYSGIRLIKAFNREHHVRDQFLRESDRYRRKKLQLDFIESLFHPMLLMLIGFSVILVVWQGGLMVMQGLVSIGNIAEFVIYVNYLIWPVASLGYTLNLLQRSAASNTRIQKLLNESTNNGAAAVRDSGTVKHRSPEKNSKTGPAEQTSRPADFPGIRKSLVFRNVTFTYPGAETPALNNVSLEAKAGQRVGIVGRTGSGKTTLVQLIPRIYDPQKGRIEVDGTDIRDFDLSSLRLAIGYVPQETFLFSDTIRENISFGKEGATEEEIRKAADQAQVLENILEFDKKFDTILGERGITFSGGQKQRTSIARALIRKPDILILDDSLSAVDTKTEDAIIKNLDTGFRKITTFIICHRLISLKHVDVVYVLDDGQIVEFGTHEELITRNGYFANMYRKQMIEEELQHI